MDYTISMEKMQQAGWHSSYNIIPTILVNFAAICLLSLSLLIAVCTCFYHFFPPNVKFSSIRNTTSLDENLDFVHVGNL